MLGRMIDIEDALYPPENIAQVRIPVSLVTFGLVSCYAGVPFPSTFATARLLQQMRRETQAMPKATRNRELPRQNEACLIRDPVFAREDTSPYTS